MTVVEVLDTDITTLAVDAIANAANTDLAHGGGVAGAISRAGGPAVQRESDARAPIELGAAVETTAGDMPARWVIHAATMVLGGPTSADVIRRATAATLTRADELGARSLALVAFGTGVGGFPLDAAAAIEVEEVRRHLASGSGLERVVFAVHGDAARRAFEAAAGQIIRRSRGTVLAPAVAQADRGLVRPLASLFSARDHSVDGALATVRGAGWREVSHTRGERVVVGPGGIVLVPERSGAGRIRDEWGDEARAHAQPLERMTGRPVTALVVLARHVDWHEPRPLRGATVLPVAGLAARLTGLSRTLAPADVDALAARLQRAHALQMLDANSRRSAGASRGAGPPPG